MYAAFNPALERFNALEASEREEFRSALAAFLNLYSFMSQVLPWVEPDSERLYIYGRALVKLLPAIPDGRLELGSDVVLTHLRIEEQGTADIELVAGEGEPGSSFPGEGRGRTRDPRFDRLGNITDELNRHFGLALDERDRLAFEQFEVTWLNDDGLRAVANANDLAGFRLEFERAFARAVLDNEEANHDLYDRLRDNDAFRERAIDWYLARVYEVLRAGALQEMQGQSAETISSESEDSKTEI